MVMSPAKASFQRKLAALGANAGGNSTSSAAPMPTQGPVASEYQLLLATLQIDMNRLRQIQSTERKIEAKREMIGKYLPWIEGALAAEIPAQDEIVGNMVVWAIDIADWPLAERLATHVITHNLALPERFKRAPATVIAEQVAEAGLLPTPVINRIWLQRFTTLVEPHDIFDQVRAKLAKATGLALQAEAAAFDPTAETAIAGGKSALLRAARDSFATALALDKGAGVKKLIEKIESELKKAASPETTTTT
ncbi:MAG: phage terminase small subunit [Novosphingobium sp.]